MSHRSRVWAPAALLGASLVLGAPPLRAEYIVCYVPDSHQTRLSCEATCGEGERLVQSFDEEWAGCSTEVPYCGTHWSEWEPDEFRGGAVPLADPCPAGCWRTVTKDSQFRLEDGMSQFRVLWQCHGVEAGE